MGEVPELDLVKRLEERLGVRLRSESSDDDSVDLDGAGARFSGARTLARGGGSAGPGGFMVGGRGPGAGGPGAGGRGPGAGGPGGPGGPGAGGPGGPGGRGAGGPGGPGGRGAGRGAGGRGPGGRGAGRGWPGGPHWRHPRRPFYAAPYDRDWLPWWSNDYGTLYWPMYNYASCKGNWMYVGGLRRAGRRSGASAVAPEALALWRRTTSCTTDNVYEYVAVDENDNLYPLQSSDYPMMELMPGQEVALPDLPGVVYEFFM